MVTKKSSFLHDWNVNCPRFPSVKPNSTWLPWIQLWFDYVVVRKTRSLFCLPKCCKQKPLFLDLAWLHDEYKYRSRLQIREKWGKLGWIYYTEGSVENIMTVWYYLKISCYLSDKFSSTNVGGGWLKFMGKWSFLRLWINEWKKCLFNSPSDLKKPV